MHDTDIRTENRVSFQYKDRFFCTRIPIFARIPVLVIRRRYIITVPENSKLSLTKRNTVDVRFASWRLKFTTGLWNRQLTPSHKKQQKRLFDAFVSFGQPRLERKCHNFDENFNTGDTESSHLDNFRCSQCRHFCQNDIYVSVDTHAAYRCFNHPNCISIVCMVFLQNARTCILQNTTCALLIEGNKH